jgi:hypothetical protein
LHFKIKLKPAKLARVAKPVKGEEKIKKDLLARVGPSFNFE